MRNSTVLRTTVLLLAVALTAAACKKKTEAVEELDTDDSKPAVDPALAEAVAAASASAAPSAGQAAQEGGPPPNGVFGPGEADKELTRGASPKITLGGEGSAPRVRLVALPPEGKSQLRVRFVQMSGRSGLPLDLQLALEVSSPKTPEEGPASAGPERSVVATIQTVKIDAAKLAQQVPETIETEVAKLKGSRVTFTLDATGTGKDFSVEASKAAGREREDVLNSLGGLLATITLPVPEEPVGQGALWMATTRETVLGIDTLSYRLIKVDRFEGGKAILKLDTKRYAADARQLVPSLGEGGAVEFQAFHAEGTGFVTVPTNGGFPLESKIERNLRALFTAGSSGTQPMMMQERVEGVIEGVGTAPSVPDAPRPAPPPAPAATAAP